MLNSFIQLNTIEEFALRGLY